MTELSKQPISQASFDKSLILLPINHPGEPVYTVSQRIVEYLRRFAQIQTRQSHLDWHIVQQLGGKPAQ